MGEYEGELSRLVDELNRSARREKTDDKTLLDQLLSAAVQRGASDLLLVAGSPAVLRVNGALTSGVGRVLSDADLRGLLLPILTAEQTRELHTRKSLDFSFVRRSIGRFRANFHYQRGTLAAAIRVLPEQIPTLECLHLPPALAAHRPNAARAWCCSPAPPAAAKAPPSPPSSSSSTPAAATTSSPSRTPSSSSTPTALRSSSRSSWDTIRPALPRPCARPCARIPNVILIGEMRDAETMAAALTAAETGHLVFSSLHTNDAAQTVLRILDIFPAGYQSQIRQQLSMALLAVISQRLVPAANGAAATRRSRSCWPPAAFATSSARATTTRSAPTSKPAAPTA